MADLGESAGQTNPLVTPHEPIAEPQSSESQSSEPLSSEPHWNRLHPVTVIRELLSLVWNFVIAIVASRGFGGFGDFSGPNVMGQSIGFEDILAVVFLGFGVIRYLATSYAITADAVIFRRGVFVRSRTVLPRDRIQNVAIGADLVGRLFGMQTLTVSSAGSEGEIELAVVSKDVARDLSAELTRDTSASGVGSRATLDRPGGSTVNGVPSTGVSAAGESIGDSDTLDGAFPAPVGSPSRREFPGDRLTEWYTLATPEFVRYGLTSNAVGAAFVFLVVAAVAFLQFDNPLLLFGGFGLIAPVIIVLDIFGFVASTDDERIRVQHGMFSTREKWARLERIQLGDVRRPWLRHRLGFETLAVATADVTESSNGQFDLCAPMIPVQSWRSRFVSLGLQTELDEDALIDVSRVTVRRRTIRNSVAPVLGLVVLGLVWRPAGVLVPMMIMMAIPMVIMTMWMLAKRSFRVDGWALGHDHLLVRRGCFDERLLLVRLEKVQSVGVDASFFQRRLGLASVRVDTANVGVSTTIPDLERDEAERLAFALVIAANTTVLPDGV